MPEPTEESAESTADLLQAARDNPELADALFPSGLPISVDDSAFAEATLEYAQRAGERVVQTPAETLMQTVGSSYVSTGARLVGGRRARPIVSAYMRNIRDHLNMLGTWIPSLRVELGDVGPLSDEILTRVSRLGELGVRPPTIEDLGAANIQLSAGGSLRFEIAKPGRLSSAIPRVPVDSSGIILRLSGEGTTFVQLHGVHRRRFADSDLQSIRHALLELQEKGVWQQNWIVVNEVIYAEKGIILVSGAREAMFEFAMTDIPTNENARLEIDMLASGSVQLVHTEGTALTVLAEHGITPFYRAITVKRRWLAGDPEIRQIP